MTSNLFLKCVVTASITLSSSIVSAADWFPLKVNQVGVDGEVVQIDYEGQKKASQNWPICVSFPHMKDPFWLAANYGVVEEAKRLGVSVQVLDAGGYTQLNNQISQIENCVAGGAKAVVMVSIDAEGVGNLLKQLKEKNIVVIDAFNGSKSTDVAARVLTNPRDEGFRAGEYLAKKHPKGTPEVRVGWLPGPAGAGFVEGFNAGFKDGIKDSAVVIAETKYGDVGKEIQARLVEDMLQTHKNLDYIVGTAVMVEGALPLLKARKLLDKVKLVSVYMTPGVHQGLKKAEIEAAGVAPIVTTAKMTIDSAVRILEQGDKPEALTRVDTIGTVYTPADVSEFDPAITFAPAGFRPVFSFGK